MGITRIFAHTIAHFNFRFKWLSKLAVCEVKENENCISSDKDVPFEEYKDERGADKTSRKQRCGDCYRKI